MSCTEKPNEERRIICFHNPDEPNGYLSNWYPAYFHADGINYSSVEQYMMYQKAILFDDLATAEKIVKTNSAAAMKAYGRVVTPFDDEKWGEHRYRVVYRGVFEKFRQNEGLACQLVNTGDAILAECAVKDIIWGIGLSTEDQRRFSVTEWRGQNLLGRILMEIRGELTALQY